MTSPDTGKVWRSRKNRFSNKECCISEKAGSDGMDSSRCISFGKLNRQLQCNAMKRNIKRTGK